MPQWCNVSLEHAVTFAASSYVWIIFIFIYFGEAFDASSVVIQA